MNTTTIQTRATLARNLAASAAYATGCMLEPNRSRPDSALLTMVVQAPSNEDGHEFRDRFVTAIAATGMRHEVAAPVHDGIGWEVSVAVEVG